MSDHAQGKESRKTRGIRMLLLVLALLTSPGLCFGAMHLLDALPSTWLPGPVDFLVNLFKSDARVENRTAQTFYLTAVTTTYGDPRVIPQDIALRQRDIPIQPHGLVFLKYDSADAPLAGIAVCQADDDCRLLPVKNSGDYPLDSYESLEPLDPIWWGAIQSAPLYNYTSLVVFGFSLAPVMLFFGWLYLSRRKTSGAE